MGHLFSNFNYLSDQEPNKVVVSVTIEPDILKQVDLLCKANRVSRSYFFRESLKLALEVNTTNKNKGYVYVAHLENTPTYKIGRSERPDERIKHDFGASFPYEVKPVIFIETSDMMTLEKAFHRHFKDVRLGNTEWFELKPPHLDWIISKGYEEIDEMKRLIL